MWRRALRPRWVIGAILVILAVPVMIRLGFWQLDRLKERRTFNQRVLSQIDAPELTLNEDALANDLYEMEFRHVNVTGQYDHQQQVVLRNQAWNGRIGFRLLTPLVIENDEAVVMVDRGWIPAENDSPESWQQYDEAGAVTIDGMLRRPDDLIGITNIEDQNDTGDRQIAWLEIDIAGLSSQTEYELLPAYIQELPSGDDLTPPIPIEPDIEVTEGPHLGYAFQWFTFATIAAVGFPLFMYRELRNEIAEDSQTAENA